MTGELAVAFAKFVVIAVIIVVIVIGIVVRIKRWRDKRD